MERITKAHLEIRVSFLNKLCRDWTIDKEYEIGYRNGYCYLDHKSPTHAHCIIRSIAVGTKREVNEAMSTTIDVLS